VLTGEEGGEPDAPDESFADHIGSAAAASSSIRSLVNLSAMVRI
jgi:hypothetical protein